MVLCRESSPSTTPTSLSSNTGARPSQDRFSKQDSDVDIPSPIQLPALGMDDAADGLPRQRSSLNHARIAGRLYTKPEGSSGLPPGRWDGHDDIHEIGDPKHSALSSDEELRSGSSSYTTSDDVELDHMGLGDRLSDDEETGLTKGDRRRRRRRQRRHTLVDERIAVGADIEKQERALADKSIVTRLLVNAVLIGLWLVVSPSQI